MKQTNNDSLSTYSSPTIFFVCNDFERALGLELLIPNFHIICIDFNEGIIAARNKGAKIFCLEEILNKSNPIFRNSYRLLKTTEVKEYISKHTPKGEISNLIFFKIAHNIEHTCQEMNYKILNTSADLNQLFELKLSQYKELNSKSICFPTTIIGQLCNNSYPKLVKKLGTEFVIQYDRGHTGSSTVFITKEEEYSTEIKKYPTRIAKFSTYISGTAWTINACITRFGIAYGGLCYQITGIPECTTKLGGTVGNDWTLTKMLSTDTIDQIKSITQNAGLKMAKSNYKGLFGLDFVIDKNGKVYLIEINARQAASTGMHTKLMLKANKIPLQLFHIAEFLYPTDNIAYISFIKHTLNTDHLNIKNISSQIIEQNNSELTPYSASQLVIRNTKTANVTSTTPFSTGIYSIKDYKLIKIREGYSISEIHNNDEFVLLSSNRSRIISPESEITRIQKLKSVLKLNGNIIKEYKNPNITKEILNIISIIK